MIKSLSKPLLLTIITILLLVSSCDSPSPSSPKNSQEAFTELRQRFESKTFTNVLPYEFRVDWNGGQKGYSKELETTYYEFSVIWTNKPDTKNIGPNRPFTVSYKILAIKNGTEPRFYALKLIGSPDSPIEGISWSNLKNFTGHIYVIDQQGQKLVAQKYTDGQYEAEIRFISEEEFKEFQNSRRRLLVECYTETTHHYTDWYQQNMDGSLVYLDTTYDGVTYNEVCTTSSDGSGGSTGGGGGGGSSTYNEYTQKLYQGEILTDSSFENTKAECIFDKLNNLSKDFSSAIQKFDGEFPVSHLRFMMDGLGTNVAGETRPPAKDYSPDYIITIVLNNNNTKAGVNYRPNLMVAKTIVHEVIHAEMFRKLLSLANDGNLDFDGWTEQRQIDYVNSIKGNFPGIYDYYRRHKDWQHQQMAGHYRDTMADILQRFDGFRNSRQFYLDIAWEGLMSNDDSNIVAWDMLSENQQEEIKRTILNYINDNKYQVCQQ